MTILTTTCDNFNRTASGTFHGMFDLKTAESYIKQTYTHISIVHLVNIEFKA
jgi:hypothetical protein